MALSEAEARARSGLIDVDTYDVFLDLTADPPTSHTEIRFGCRQPGASTFAELTLAQVHSTTLNGQALEAPQDGRLLLPDLAADNVLTVEGELAYSPSGRGLTRFTDPADDETYLAIACYPGSASDIFCCFDQPDLSAAMTFSVRAPAGWECVGNGQVEQRPPAGQGGVWRLETMHAMRPFDVAMCAGPFTVEWSADRSVQVSARRRRSLTGADGIEGMTWFGELALSAIDRYEQVLGIACPFSSYDIVFVPELIALALSVPGLMLVHERIVGRLADHDDFATMVCAHEAAHLWFGSMVGMRWWDDVWLDEAITTYLSYSPATSPLPSGGGWTDFCYRDKERAYLADALPTREPVSSPVASSAEALSRPSAITYVKGASVIRQLAALIGDAALHAGFAEYLTRHRSSGVASLDDLVSCMSHASGRELTAWADEWLRTPGASTLVPELVAAPDGTIESMSVTQDTPRTHVIQVGIYDLDGVALRRRRAVITEISGARTSIAALAGEKLPSALILNEDDLAYARIGFDEQTLQSLAAVAMDVGDPLTEAVCWNAAWHLVTGGALAAADLAELIVRRLGTLPLTDDEPLTRTEVLLERALKCADLYAPPSARGRLRERLAETAIGLARNGQPGSAQQRTLAEGFTASADQRSQLDLLRSWLAGHFLPEGLAVTASLRGQILLALSTRALATDSDLDTLAIIDPLQGELMRATCVAARPDPASKEFAWTRALTSDGDRRLPEAYAQGLWRPGQEAIMGGYLDRYFAEALPAISGREPKTMRTLARSLFPSTLIGAATIEAGEAVLKAGWLDSMLANVVAEQVAVVRGALAAQSVPQRPGLAS